MFNDGSAGGSGGGFLGLNAPRISVDGNGAIECNGEDGTIGGGGGSGGMIRLECDSLEVAVGGTISAVGGKGGNAKNGCIGGNGSDGVIVVVSVPVTRQTKNDKKNKVMPHPLYL